MSKFQALHLQKVLEY